MEKCHIISSKYYYFRHLYCDICVESIKKTMRGILFGGWGPRPVAFTQTMGEHINVPSILCNTCVNVRILVRLLHIIKVFLSLNGFINSNF